MINIVVVYAGQRHELQIDPADGAEVYFYVKAKDHNLKEVAFIYLCLQKRQLSKTKYFV